MTVNDDAVPSRTVVLSPRHATAAGAILARSHADYPSFRHLFPEPKTAGPRLERDVHRCRS